MKNTITAIILALIAPISSFAGTASNTFKSVAKVNSSCVLTTTDVNLGDITATSTTASYASASGTINMQCSNGTSYRVYQGWGTNGSSDGRYLKGTNFGTKLRYFVCTGPGVALDNCAGDKRWYDVGYQYYLSATGTGESITYPVYINALKSYATPDTYTSSIVTTISY